MSDDLRQASETNNGEYFTPLNRARNAIHLLYNTEVNPKRVLSRLSLLSSRIRMVRVIGLGGGEFRLRPWCMGSALMLVPPEEVDEGGQARERRVGLIQVNIQWTSRVNITRLASSSTGEGLGATCPQNLTPRRSAVAALSRRAARALTFASVPLATSTRMWPMAPR